MVRFITLETLTLLAYSIKNLETLNLLAYNLRDTSVSTL